MRAERSDRVTFAEERDGAERCLHPPRHLLGEDASRNASSKRSSSVRIAAPSPRPRARHRALEPLLVDVERVPL